MRVTDIIHMGFGIYNAQVITYTRIYDVRDELFHCFPWMIGCSEVADEKAEINFSYYLDRYPRSIHLLQLLFFSLNAPNSDLTFQDSSAFFGNSMMGRSSLFCSFIHGVPIFAKRVLLLAISEEEFERS